MNQHVSISYEQALKDAAKARKVRFKSAVQRYEERKRPVIVTINPISAHGRFKPKYLQTMNDRLPIWKTSKVYFNAHVICYQRHIEQERPSIRRYIARRAIELGSSFEVVVGPRRSNAIVRVRQLIIWELKRLIKPDISYPDLGRIFNRDHTTVIHAVRRVDELKGWKPE